MKKKVEYANVQAYVCITMSLNNRNKWRYGAVKW
jgi:hypothetical protein